MYFNKAINEITFDDVAAFLKQQVPENTTLDYKLILPRDNEKFAKTIAAFANSMGGTVIIGVKDEHDKPKPPFTGIPFHPKIRGQIESIIQNYIDPIVFVDIATCKDPRSDNMFVVLNIPQSNLTPHLVGKLKRAYVRTGQSSSPEVIVHPDKLPWLLDNRKKSQNLRRILSDKAEAHFNNYLRAQNKTPESALAAASLLLTPLYPQAPYLDYKDLPNLLKSIRLDKEGNTFPPSGGDIKTVQDGIVSTLSASGTLELNSYGLMFYKTALADENKYLDPLKFFEDTILFFKLAAKFYAKLGYISPLMLRLKMANARGVKVKTQQGDKTILEDYIRLDRDIWPSDLQNNLTNFTHNLLADFAWAINMPFEREGEYKNFIDTLLNKYI
ncbi:MAG: ATP-binding protein [Elusimicrobiota bacterium]|jgi:hypothetical protein|nr:ATP-binding protein [Elusimicrobiota bacterium]